MWYKIILKKYVFSYEEQEYLRSFNSAHAYI